MKKHFVTFLSPGTFVHEESTYPIDSWDVEAACEKAHSVNERHGARPFAFEFTTRERKDDELDSKVIKTSGRYFLGGQLLAEKEVQAMNKSEPSTRDKWGVEHGKYDILLSNMKNDGWNRMVMNDNSWRIFQPLGKNDVILDFKLKPKTQMTK